MKIALLPGGFKPPHLGHYNMAKYLADFADNVIVRIGQKEREGIGAPLALEVWNFYKEFDSDPRAQKLTISIAQSPSPVKDVYDFVEKIAPEGSTVILGLGEKDASDGRYNSIPKFAEPRNIKAEIELVPPQAGGISGTRMREIIKSNDKTTFFKYIPDYLPEEIKEEIWTKLVDTTMPSDVDERVSFQSDIDVEDVEFIDAQADADMDPIDVDLTSQHFFDRLNDPRNYPNIELDELELFFAKLADKKEEFIEFLNQYKIVVAKDNQTDINIPFMKLANKAIAKTIMRKRNFQTSDPILPLEEFMGGTMNKEEMAKHMANMKKLRKFFSKQGDQMTQVPTDLTKGLKRKLYEKLGIQRGTIESEVQFLSREILELFKQNIGEPFEAGEIEGYIEGSEVVLEYEVEVKFIPNDGIPGYSFDASTDDEDIEIEITYNPGSFPAELNNLNAELKETLRHEIEHITQFGFDLKGGFEQYKGKIDFYKYLLLTHEIPAFVRGLYKRAKVKKMSLIDTFDEFFEEYEESFNSPEEINQVRNVWLDWARSNLPDAQLDENYPPYKANQVQQTRYRASDTFTNDPKKAKKLGYLEDNAVDEGDTYEKMAAKGKKAGNLKQGTVRKRLNIPKGEKIPLSLINKELARLKKMEKRSAKNQKYYKALTLAKTLKTTTNLNEVSAFTWGAINDIFRKTIDQRLYNDGDGIIWLKPFNTKEGFEARRKMIFNRIRKKGGLGGVYHYDIDNIYDDIWHKLKDLPYNYKGPIHKRLYTDEAHEEFRQKIYNNLGINEGRDPKVGTGKKPKGSGRRLYTDENPKDTVSIKFSTRQDIVDTLSKKSFKSKSHARQSQIINLIHQRVRAAHGRAKDPAVKKRLKTALNYITKRKEASKRKTQRMRKEGLFSQDWWLDVITEEILNEGGAAGHMAHPFDLPNVKTGKDLIKSFEQAADSLKRTPGSVKIDGVNASIRLVNFDGKRTFAMDRGSKKALDLRGVTKADLEDRFGAGHGMIKSGGDVLDIFNAALPSIQEELNALGLIDDPNVMFNMEYVSGKSNVQDYGKNFLAIHGLLKIETKEVQGARKMLTKRVTSEKPFAQSDMDELLKKLEPFAKKKGFEIYGSVPTTFTKDPDFKSALNTRYTIDTAEGDQTKTLAQWLDGVTNIPKTDRLKMNIEETDSIKDVGALSKQVYFAVFGGENVDSLFSDEQEVNKAIQGATTYLATEKLGDAILDVLDSPMGSVNDHEGVVIRDDKISPKPFKVTGKFITGGVSSDFQKK